MTSTRKERPFKDWEDYWKNSTRFTDDFLEAMAELRRDEIKARDALLRLNHADGEERARVERTIIAVLETEPDVGYAWLHGSFLEPDDGFHDVDLAVRLAGPPGRRLDRTLDLTERLSREARFPVDVRALDDAPLVFRFHVFRAGRLLLCRDDEAMADCMERTMRDYLDIEPLLRPTAIEASGVTLDPDLVRARRHEIGESVERLESLAARSLSEFLADRDATDAACYRLLVAIEAALALCHHVSARRLRKAPEEYAGCFELLGDAGLLDAELTERLQRMARLRNLLVHMYWKVDLARVHALIRQDLGDLRAFAAAIGALL